jgi:AcrR family transcriptional regulator
VVRKSNSRLQAPKTATPRARRRDRQRDAILRAAARLFRERGFADTGMRDIAEAADLSAANLYHYFDGKPHLLYYCQDRALDRMLAAVESARQAGLSTTERLRLVLENHLQTLLDEVEGATAHLQIESLPPALRAAIIKKRDRYELALRRLIADGIRAGDLVDMDPAIAARAMLGAMNWTVTWFRPEGPMTAALVGDVISRFLVRGIAARTPAAKRTLSLVPWKRDDLHKSRGAAPGSQGATTKDSEPIYGRSNAARRDAPPGNYVSHRASRGQVPRRETKDNGRRP